MKPIIKKIFLRSITLFMLFILSGMLMSCQSEQKDDVIKESKAEQTSGPDIKAVNELMVASNVDHQPSKTFWCGSEPMLAYKIRGGGYFVKNIETGETVAVPDNSYGTPIGCTPDGKWLLYKNRNSARVYKDKHGQLPDNDTITGDGPGWYGYIHDLYRYELTTGRWQKFAVVRDDSRSLVSPDGSKVLLGNKHDSTIDIPELEWEKVWLTNNWNIHSTHWFADSSGIVTIVWGSSVGGASLGVEMFGEDGWAKEFNLEKSVCAGQTACNANVVAVDKENRFYLLESEEIMVDNREVGSKKLLFTCRIEQKELLCEEKRIYEVRGRIVRASEFLPNGDYIFSSDDYWYRRNDNYDCIRRLRAGQTNASCIADTHYGKKTYEDVLLFTASSNGRLMAFRRGRRLSKPHDQLSSYQYDLFVMELPKD